MTHERRDFVIKLKDDKSWIPTANMTLDFLDDSEDSLELWYEIKDKLINSFSKACDELNLKIRQI